MCHRAFTLVELIFIIVILGILASIALPKIGPALESGYLSKAKSTVTAIRGGLQLYKTKHILLGQSPYLQTLDSDTNHLFDQVLPEAIPSSTDIGGWSKENDSYVFHIKEGKKIVFDYDPTKGSFTCNRTKTDPARLCDQF